MTTSESELRKVAMKLRDVEEGVACEGTKLESWTYETNEKAFLFVNATHARLKLGASIDEAKRIAAKDDRYKVGANGWATVAIDGGVDAPLLTKWIAESHALMSGAAGARNKSATAKKKKTAAKRPAKKKAAKAR